MITMCPDSSGSFSPAGSGGLASRSANFSPATTKNGVAASVRTATAMNSCSSPCWRTPWRFPSWATRKENSPIGAIAKAARSDVRGSAPAARKAG